MNLYNLSGLLFVLILIICPVLQYIAMVKLKGGFLSAAKVSLVALGGIYMFTLYAYMDGAHLWPWLLLFGTPVLIAYLLLIFLLNWLENRKRKLEF